ncbi:M48 family metalloprotease [Streptomyces sp. NBC_00566]|uniref:M48 family metalloprotease n=1 Tax=Streptomyces sp. NBC_00566 TaxID=2975778 RepID=UPI002E817B81|nr:M48 family metalloprotease [Streptomyces sp. NBC_00566]WUB85486.1 M48 family metalloprotease [Streptomyces sp. NBC_00566]
MITLLLIPLVLPWALPPLARRTVERVRPEVALWTVTCATFALAAGVVASLGVLLLPLTLAFPPAAALAELIQPLDAGPRLLVLGLSALASGGLALAIYRVLRKAAVEVVRLRAAHSRIAGLPDAGGLCVLDDPRPDAFALPGGLRRADRIVVTTGMLRALGPVEREALLAHERAHLAAKHHLFLSAAQLAGWCHPALSSVTGHVSFAAERAADEAAARHCGDRDTTAQAVGRAALAASRARGTATTPALAPGAATGPVPARVKALLAPAPVRRVVPALLAMTLVCTAAGASSLAGAVWLHRGVEVAQGESPSD